MEIGLKTSLAFVIQKLLQVFSLLLCLHVSPCQPRTIITSSNGSQITTPRIIMFMRNKTQIKAAQKDKKHKKPKKSKIKQPPRLKEFPWLQLMNIGLTSNEANTFIRSNQLRGKPLEQQYEKTREADMNFVERELLGRSAAYKRVLKFARIKRN